MTGGTAMTMRQTVYDKLIHAFTPLHLELANESPMHGLPESAEKHFRIVMVSSKFEGRSRLERHRLVNDALAEELKTHIHALSIQGFTPEEWEKREPKTFASPACLGGGKREGI
ncbi:MAG TPA: BolA/IbaG family iron-sulfur metabolism protein [Bdellovibrionales bacterium]|nr:BolA/IbaG family iron-sulfur metabolism protein [Bdellovibrionales bacterium]